MTQLLIPSNMKTKTTGESAGSLTFQKHYFDFADKANASATANLGIGDQIQIGVVPAGNKLVPHLCRLDTIAFDTNGSPTGTYQVGTAAANAALKGTANAQTAVILTAEDFVLATSEIGDPHVDVPIYITMVVATATLATTGQIVFQQVIRPWDSSVDGGTDV